MEFKLVGDDADLIGHEVLLNNDVERSPLGVIPQNQRIVALSGIGFVLYGTGGGAFAKPLLPFDVEISSQGLTGGRRTSKSRIDINQFAGLRGILSKPPIAAAADALKRIEGHLGIIARQSARFNAFVDISKFGTDRRNVTEGME